MKFFTKKESVGLALILLIVGIITLTGLFTSLLRARDAQRISDLGALSEGLLAFHEEYGFFPPSENGKIKMCKGPSFEEVLAEVTKLPKFDRQLFLSGMRVCEWGTDGLFDVVDESREPYIKILPKDPKDADYLYLSTMNRFQLFTYLEDESGNEFYDQEVQKRALSCGSFTCNSGRAYANTPLDKSLEEYENELKKNEQ